jgi:hypothetical protein
MTTYDVHIYREMRLTFGDIDAASPEAAAAFARGKPTDEADSIEDCNGDDLAALVDEAADGEYERSVTIDFEPERQRKASARILAAIEGIIDYAENEAYSLEKLKDSPEAEAEAASAWQAVEAARATITEMKALGVLPDPAQIDLHALLAARRQIALIWSVEDVLAVRPDLTDDEAWEVLQQAGRRHDAEIGINWDVLRCHAKLVHGDAPESHAAFGGGDE